MLITGTAHWAKVVGAPSKSDFSPNGQWSFDLSIDEETQNKLLKAGMKKSYLKNKGDDRGVFLSFSRDAIRKNGEAGKPYRIVDAQGNPWPDNKLIGNGSVLNVIVSLNEREYKKEKFLKPSAISIQVWDHVPFESKSGDFPTKAEAEDQATGTGEW